MPLGVKEAVPVGDEDPTFGWGTSWVESSFTSMAWPLMPDIEPVDAEVPDAEVLEVELPDAELSEDLLIPAHATTANDSARTTCRCIVSPSR